MRRSYVTRLARRTCHSERFGDLDNGGPDSLGALRREAQDPSAAASLSRLAETCHWSDVDWVCQWQWLARENGVRLPSFGCEKSNARGPRVRYDLTTGGLLPFGHTKAIAKQTNKFVAAYSAHSPTCAALGQALASCPFWASRAAMEKSEWRPLLEHLEHPGAKRCLSEFPGVLVPSVDADVAQQLFVNVAALSETHKKQLVELPLRGATGRQRASWDMSSSAHLVYLGSKRYLEWYGQEADAMFAARWAHHYHSRVWMPLSEVASHQFDIAAQLVVHPDDVNALRLWLASAASESPQVPQDPTQLHQQQICTQVRRIAERALEFISPSLPPAMGETHSCYVVLNSDSRKRVEHLLPLVYFLLTGSTSFQGS